MEALARIRRTARTYTTCTDELKVNNPTTIMIDKKVSPKGKSIRVTFSVPEETADKSIAVAGNFNEWNVRQHVMTLDKKKGLWTKTISFKPGTRLEFRYFADGEQWINDDTVEEYAPSGYLSANCVVEL